MTCIGQENWPFKPVSAPTHQRESLEQKDTSLIQSEEKTQIARNRSGQSVCMVPSICSKANYCKGKIYEEVIHCLCDTGATVSVIDGNLFEKLRQEYDFH